MSTSSQMEASSLTAPNPAIAYAGPREVLINQAVVLKGTYDPKRVSKVALVAEDKFPLSVAIAPTSGTWSVKLEKGFQAAGARWLRLKGTNAAGQVVDTQVVNLTVSTDPLTVGKSLSLKLLQDTFFKLSPNDSSKLTDTQKVWVKAGTTVSVIRYGLMDNHLKVELEAAIAPIGTFGFFYVEHIQLSKGSQVFRFDIDEVPTTNTLAQMLVTTTTRLKTRPADSSTLVAKDQLELLQGQTFAITGYACTQGHFRVTLAQPIAGFGDRGFVYKEHVQLKRGDRVIPYDSGALTVTALKPTVLKKRPVDSAKLLASERADFPAGRFYGVASYGLDDGNHIKLSLTEEISGFGNTGYAFPGHLQMRRGGKAFNPFPPQVELNVPYFSQRDNPRYSWATCNVTAIAMVMVYYGQKSRSGRQLEDELFQWCLNKSGVGSQTDHNILSQLIRAYGYQSSFSTTRKWSDVKTELLNRRPVVLGGDFTATGHIVCVIGYTPQGYIVNDPWGDALTGYAYTEGRKLLYPYAYMNRVAGPDGNVWAHFIAR